MFIIYRTKLCNTIQVYHHKRRIYLVVDLQLAIDRTPVTYFEENGKIQVRGDGWIIVVSLMDGMIR